MNTDRETSVESLDTETDEQVKTGTWAEGHLKIHQKQKQRDAYRSFRYRDNKTLANTLETELKGHLHILQVQRQRDTCRCYQVGRHGLFISHLRFHLSDVIHRMVDLDPPTVPFTILRDSGIPAGRISTHIKAEIRSSAVLGLVLPQEKKSLPL
ncbi:hypothetical protein Baya_1128 [Bagarius yarrelli]|uniref:Uncharacterized protein n=1 Tax=Bagarius yarrelli TaxID=175774 RepID=A0A556TK85_BAGYA|nr:hypothetical protein Baya_1128 [Bagarius yarrelli]